MNRLHMPQLWFIFFIGCCFFPSQSYAADVLPTQKINIAFDLERNIVYGTSKLFLPPATNLHLYINGLDNLKIVRITAGGTKTVALDDSKSISLKAHPLQQTFSLSWQLAAPKKGHGFANLIGKDGITLTGLWHPVPDQDMIFSLRAELPSGFSGVTEANRLITSSSNPKRVLTATAPQPLRSINFVAGPYTVRSRKIDKTTVYTYFFSEDAKLAQSYLNKAKLYIQHYEQLIGPFPYTRYSIVENRLPTGYGMPGFTLLGQAVIRLPFIKDTSLGHEILHSWFGNSLQPDDSGNWCEGLTTYLADQSFASEQGQGSSYRKNQLLRYQSHVVGGNLTTLIDFQHGGDSQPMAKKMRAIGYDKGSMLFHMLRREVGDTIFFNALRTLYTEKKFKRIGWSDIETIFSREAEQDLTRFFGQWLLRNDLPDISIQNTAIEQKQGKSIVTFTVVQQNKNPYLLKIPVTIETLNGSSRQVIEVNSQNEEVSLTVNSLPTTLTLDPDYDLMRTLHNDELAPVWIRFLGAKQKIAVLPEQKKLEIYLPLMAELERQGCKLVPGAELKNSDLSSGSFIFLGDTLHTQGLLGKISPPLQGFSLDVRNNPLADGQVIVLINSSSTEETTRIIHKINHYGKYSFLHFLKGIIQEKHIAPVPDGIGTNLLAQPKGIPVKEVQPFEEIIENLSQSRVVYVGETHTDFGAHILQLQVIQSLFTKNPELMIGMEMFPRSSQQALDEYISGKITDEREFLKKSNYFSVWGFDYRLYRDIIDFARKHQIPVKALNLDKKIVSTVFQKGATDTLTDEQWKQVATVRDLTLPGYQQRLKEIHAMHAGSPHGSNFSGFLQAQSMWDETMAESIVFALQDNPQENMVVIAGTGHVYKDSAIPPRVDRRMKVKQSVLIANNGLENGKDQGRHADYLMFTEAVEISPAGKIGVVLSESAPEGDTLTQVTIVQINSAGQADEAGLKIDDVILMVDDFAVTTIGDLKAGLMNKDPGETVRLTIKRKETTVDISVELSDMDKVAMTMPPGHPKK